MKTNLSKILALALCVLMLLPALQVLAAAAPATETIEINYEDSVGLDLKEFIDSKDGDGLRDTFITAFKEGRTTVDLSEFSIPTGEASSLVYWLADDVPESFCSSGRISYSSFVSDGTAYIANLTWFYSDDCPDQATYLSILATAEEEAEWLLYGIKDNDSLDDFTKAFLIHDRMAQYCEYSCDDLRSDRYHNIQGFFTEHKAVCQGIAHAYEYLLAKVGVDAYYCSSDAMNHGWNIVYIDGVPYFADVTFDDPIIDISGRVNHENLIKSKVSYAETHEEDGVIDYDQTPVTTTYDDAFWTTSKTAFQLVGDYIYYIMPAATGSTTQSFYKTPATTLADNSDDTLITTLSAKWYTTGGYYTFYSMLSTDGRNVFYNTGNTVYKYDTATGTSSVFYAPEVQTPDAIYGFTYDGKTLYTEISSTPNFGSFENKHSIGVSTEMTDESTCGQDNHLEWVRTEAAPATCTEDGTTAYTVCYSCKTVLSQPETIPAAHTPGEAAVENRVEATETAEGGYDTVIRCTECNEIISSEHTSIPATGHTHTPKDVPAKAATCTEDGYTAAVICTACNEYITEPERIPATGHTKGAAVQENVVAATCTKQGSYDLVSYCTECGIEMRREKALTSSKGHSGYVAAPAKEPTCTESGVSEKVICTVCNEVLSEATVIPATGHSPMVTFPAINPTCTEQGCTAEYKCEYCGQTLTASTIIPAKGHTQGAPVKENVVAATCTANGSYDEVVYCTVCQAEISRTSKTTGATAHSLYASAPATEPTCTAKGSTAEYSCSVCKQVITEAAEISSKGHNLTVHSAKAPTCTQEGCAAYENCTRCDYTTYTAVPALGHDKKQSEGTPATCTDKGVAPYEYCTRCDYNTMKQTPALGHSYEGDTCTRCGNVKPACSHMCHNGNFFWKFINFFNKLFKINQYCSCGKAHW